jgi:type II secretory pathway pseudopilin PulG
MVEILAVIAVIGLLAALILGVSSGVFSSGAKARAQGEISHIAAALEDYRNQFGDYPHLRSGVQGAEGDVLFLAVAGYRGPRGDVLPTTARSRIFVDFSRLTTDIALAATFNTDASAPTPNPVLVDPWRRPFYYRYRMTDTTPGAGFSSSWTNVGFFLASAGPDGRITLPTAAGAYNPLLPENQDNIVLTR